MLMPKQRFQLVRLRWTAFVIVGLAYVLSFFHRYAPATIAGDLREAFHANSVSLGVLAATYFYVYTVMQIPTGILVDTVGPRWVVVAGGVFAGAGSWMFGVAESLDMAIWGRLLIGFGVSMTFISMLKLNAVWFHERHFATVTGATILLGNMGSLLAATPLTWALNHISWRVVFQDLGQFSLLLALLTWWLVRDDPEKVGLPSLREQEGEVAHPARQGHWFDGLKTVLSNRATWPGLFVNMGQAGSLFAFGGLWAVPYLRDVHGLDRAAATERTTLLLLGFSIGAFFVGALSDRFGRRKPLLIIGSSIYALCLLPMLFDVPLQGVSGYILFFAMGMFASTFTLCWSCAKEVNAHALSGMATSVVNIGAFLGTAMMQPAIGWVIDRVHSGLGNTPPTFEAYRAGVAILLLFALIAVLATLFIRETFCRSVVVTNT